MIERSRLAVLFGGRSPEHEVSVVSARSILREADAERFEIMPLGITRGGAWLTPEETQRRLERSEADGTNSLGDEEGAGLLSQPELLSALADVAVVFPIVHGRNGEDGTLQGLLELAGTPYVGSGVAASAIGMDKAHMRAVFAAHDVPQPRYEVLRDQALSELISDAPSREALTRLEQSVGYPCFAKPANGGSSIGISRVAAREELGDALLSAARYDRKVLVEEAIDGREIECAVLGNADPRPSPLGEIRPNAGVLQLRREVRRHGRRADRARRARRAPDRARTGDRGRRVPGRRLRRTRARRLPRPRA